MPVTHQASREFKLIGEIPEGADWRLSPCGTFVVVVHPDHLPYRLYLDGRKEEIRPEPIDLKTTNDATGESTTQPGNIYWLDREPKP
jgi:hypothetical protein